MDVELGPFALVCEDAGLFHPVKEELRIGVCKTQRSQGPGGGILWARAGLGTEGQGELGTDQLHKDGAFLPPPPAREMIWPRKVWVMHQLFHWNELAIKDASICMCAKYMPMRLKRGKDGK